MISQVNSYRFLTDDTLLAQCRLDNYRGSGPGGQKRNKTSNAVRLVHEPTGLIVTATETRSLQENKSRAIKRMRLKLAAEIREPVDLLKFSPPDWLLEIRHNHRLDVSHRHPYYAATAGLILDLFMVLGANPADVAANLGVSTTTVIKLLEDEPMFWMVANKFRADAGLTPLTHRG